MVQVHRFSVMQPMGEIVAGLNELQPHGLTGYSSTLYELAHEARAGRLQIAPKTIGPNAEPLLPEMRKAMEEAWGAPVGGTWGTSEACATGQSCMMGGGMHLAEDLMIVEPVDDAGRPVHAGRAFGEDPAHEPHEPAVAADPVRDLGPGARARGAVPVRVGVRPRR